ncbi:ethionine resistance-conferring protein 1 [[Candida] jaroonii]|uniref:Ethionine resistance-conferring protein 1 n=1 Tax=[Candida] jaroonii TaxID=467808 RepID=A0ACA9Y7E9_9ASCO|nr:ethionine resistance-conferring protein 1 [[Candida] jaroonii]
MSEEQLLTGGFDNYEAIEVQPPKKSTLESELKFTAKSSGPLIISFFLQYLLSVTTIFSAGKLGAKELAAASLAVCTFNITGLAVYQGMSTSLDSFCSQAFGSGDFFNVGVYFQRCSLMIFVVTIFPLSFIWWFAADILTPMIGDRELAELTQLYLRVITLGTPGLFLFETGKRFLQAQHIFNAATYILLIVAPINIILNYILVWHPDYGLGFIGAPIACTIVYWLMTILLVLYIIFIDGKKCWNGFDFQKASINWIPMLKLALPGVIMVEAEYLAFEVLTILAASFGTDALAAQSIASNVGSLAFQLAFAVAVAITTRIGHFVGSKDVTGARNLLKVFLILSSLLSVVNFSLLFFGRSMLARLFTDEKGVLEISKQLITLAAINQIFDSFNVLGAGVLRGQGKQRIGSILNMISYYIIALPIGYILAFPYGHGVAGLWCGLICGVAFLAVSECVVIYFSDWEAIFIESYNRHDH